MNKKKLLDVTNAFLAIEDLKNSSILSPETRRTLERARAAVEEESSKLLQEEELEGESSAAD